MEFAMVAIFIIFILIIVAGTSKRCDDCGKWFAMVEVEAVEISRENYSEKKKVPIKNSKGETIGSTVTYIPRARITYACIDKCKYCGFEVRINRTKEQ
jgi:hypothetical protein